MSGKGAKIHKEREKRVCIFDFLLAHVSVDEYRQLFRPSLGFLAHEHYLQLPSISHQHHQIVKEGAPDQYVDTTENRAVGRALFSSLLSG